MDPFSVCYSDDNKYITIDNGGNNGHGLKNVTCKQTLTDLSSLSAVKFMLYVHLSLCEQL